MNREPFDNGECYHIYNRGVDKRNIIMTSYDADRILKSMEFFNDVDPIISLYSLSFEEQPKKQKTQPLILTTHKLNWKPAADHPWRQFITN